MGFDNGILGVIITGVFFTLSMNAQVDQNDIDFIYNKWALTSQESRGDTLVFKHENELWFDDIPYNVGDNLNLSRYNNVFFLEHYRPIRGPVRCGNYIPKSYKRKSQWKKGIWRLEKEKDVLFLILERLRAEKGKKYVLNKRETYEVLKLDEDLLVLQKLVIEDFN